MFGSVQQTYTGRILDKKGKNKGYLIVCTDIVDEYDHNEIRM